MYPISIKPQAVAMARDAYRWYCKLPIKLLKVKVVNATVSLSQIHHESRRRRVGCQRGETNTVLKMIVSEKSDQNMWKSYAS